jgi:NYN domain
VGARPEDSSDQPAADYPLSKPEEKGVDVQLAVDFIAMAIRGEYDVGVLMSEDTDLKPPLEAVVALPATSSKARCEVAAWDPPSSPARRLRIPRVNLWCHLLDETEFRKVADTTNYA